MYLLLGCNDLSYEVARYLRGQGEEVVIVDANPRVVELSGWEVKVGDPRDPLVLQEAGIERADGVLISYFDLKDTLSILRTVTRLKRELKKDVTILALVPDKMLEQDFRTMGASSVIGVSQALGAELVKEFQKAKQRQFERNLRTLLTENPGGKMLILTHTNPDPDALASAIALKTYAKTFDYDSVIAYDGEIGYFQNRVLCNRLGVDLVRVEEIDFDKFWPIALVDVASRAYCALPRDREPTIIIDHHAVPSAEVTARLVNIERVGACSTLLANCLNFANISIDPLLAAALVVGILTDTGYLTRATPMDVEVYTALREKADRELLTALETPVYSWKTFRSLSTAMKKAKTVGPCLMTSVGQVEEEDTVSQVAEFFIKLEGIQTVLVGGIVERAVRISGRTKDTSLHLGRIFSEVFGERGGGHQNMAGAKILYARKPAQRDVNNQLKKVLKALGLVGKT